VIVVSAVVSAITILVSIVEIMDEKAGKISTLDWAALLRSAMYDVLPKCMAGCDTSGDRGFEPRSDAGGMAYECYIGRLGNATGLTRLADGDADPDV
jgi:hypothetical protein